jgi:hypothetical protein
MTYLGAAMPPKDQVLNKRYGLSIICTLTNKGADALAHL